MALDTVDISGQRAMSRILRPRLRRVIERTFPKVFAQGVRIGRHGTLLTIYKVRVTRINHKHMHNSGRPHGPA